MTAGHKRKPLGRAASFKPPSADLVLAWITHFNTDEEEARRKIREARAAGGIWVDLYQATVERFDDGGENLKKIDSDAAVESHLALDPAASSAR